jgi:hypothetical protein
VPQRRTVSSVNLSKSALVNLKPIFIGYSPNYSAGKFLEPITMKQLNVPLHRVVRSDQTFHGMDNRRSDFSMNLRLLEQNTKTPSQDRFSPISEKLPGVHIDTLTEELPIKRKVSSLNSYLAGQAEHHGDSTTCKSRPSKSHMLSLSNLSSGTTEETLIHTNTVTTNDSLSSHDFHEARNSLRQWTLALNSEYITLPNTSPQYGVKDALIHSRTFSS